MDELEPSSKPRRPWRLVAILVALVVGGAAIGYGLLKPAPDSTTAAGKDVPDFTLARLDGKGTISSADLRGRPLVINFWASWCEPCKEEVPRFQAAWETYEDEGVTVLGVDLRDTPANAREFVREEGITYPVVVDPDETLAKALNVAGLPETFFVDSKWSFQAVGSGSEVGNHSGTVVLGAISDELLIEQIEAMLAASG
jgi:cytochrome c biogenesis protein CcmG/thiol:disulfide interchange protein DsbE